MIAPVRSPEFPSDSLWLNTDRPLSLKELRGRVVILDFWTSCCINCVHILPDLRYLEEKYGDRLAVIGVHSPKFPYEKDSATVRQAILRHGIRHPVVIDNDFSIWQQYAVRAWPTFMVIDPQGYVLGFLSGEGKREMLDQLVTQLLEQAESSISTPLNWVLEQNNPQPLMFPGAILAVPRSQAEPQLFISDTGQHRIVAATPDGQVQAVIGTGQGGWVDGSLTEAQFREPQGLAWDGEKQLLYVADRANHVIRSINFRSQEVKTIAGTGQKSGILRFYQGEKLATDLNSPWDLVKIGRNLYITMAGSHQIWEMQLDGDRLQIYAGTGGEGGVDSKLGDAAFAQPSGIATDGRELFVADSEISTIRGVGFGQNAIVRTICGSAELFGFGDRDGEGFDVRLQHCLGIAVAGQNLWIADSYNHTLKRVNPRTGICETLLGDSTPGFQDGVGRQAQFFEPSGLSVVKHKLYVADTNNHAIRQVDLATLTVKTLQFPELCPPGVCQPDSSFQ